MEFELLGIANCHLIDTAKCDRHHTIRAPTLLVWGVDDPWQPIGDGERLAREVPDATLIRVEKASHWIPQDAPEEWVSHVLTFLDA